MPDLMETFGGDFMSPVPDPYRAYKRLRDEQPVTVLDLWMGPGYLVTRYDDVRTVLTDPQTYSSHSNANGIGLVMGRTILVEVVLPGEREGTLPDHGHVVADGDGDVHDHADARRPPQARQRHTSVFWARSHHRQRTGRGSGR